jgi:3-deoxy-D-manno-octulosonic-acid transferase
MLYNVALFFVTLGLLPKLVFNRGKYRRSLKARLGLEMPTITKEGTPRIWVHAVSMGEVKASLPLVQKLLEKHPGAAIYCSTTTETGYDEAKRLMPHLAAHFFLPLDFSWIIKRYIGVLKPDLLILVESDFWYHLMRAVPQVIVVNGKISEKSLKRFKKVPFFSKWLFNPVSLFCVQNEMYAERFRELGITPDKIEVTGNLKLDVKAPIIDVVDWKKQLGIQVGERVITLASTHEGEEELLLKTLNTDAKILLVPRHPERYKAVADLLHRLGYAFDRYSEEKRSAKILLVDAMGILSACYRVSDIAIVGGSFVPGLGGHNIFEPVQMGIPTLFGPYMETQTELVQLILNAHAGIQISITELKKTVDVFLQIPPVAMKSAALALATAMEGSTLRTMAALERYNFNFSPQSHRGR